MGGGAEREADDGEASPKGPTQAWVGKGRLAKRKRAAAPAAIDGQGFMLHPAACAGGTTCVGSVPAASWPRLFNRSSAFSALLQICSSLAF